MQTLLTILNRFIVIAFNLNLNYLLGGQNSNSKFSQQANSPAPETCSRSWETAVYKRSADTTVAGPSQECHRDELTLNSGFSPASRLTLQQHQTHLCAVCRGESGHAPHRLEPGIKAAQPAAKQMLKTMLSLLPEFLPH